ncbi:Transcriptional regulator (plasmid) [Streptantibioticus cattleyicolor NRRL 8057 = DSM 46488]|nr:Transcriptional regulator [Streptantibioticus cattleyicolor NRRL 8057 = DSM 46488]
MRDAREQLFAAAERVLLRDGASALTSRAVTTEAQVAKGLLHRHFADFDTFLAELVLDRIGRVEAQGAALRESAGTGTVTGNLVAALTTLFDAVAVGIVGLVVVHDAMRAKVREVTGGGLPLLNEATAMVRCYLAAERDLGRVAAHADLDALAPTLIGAAHLLFADREGARPTHGDVEKVVTTVVADAVT